MKKKKKKREKEQVAGVPEEGEKKAANKGVKPVRWGRAAVILSVGEGRVGGTRKYDILVNEKKTEEERGTESGHCPVGVVGGSVVQTGGLGG